MLAQQLLNGLVVGGVYSLFALGFTLVFGIHHLMNLAHGAVFMTGAFVALYAVLAGLPLWVGFVLALLACGLLSVLIEITAFKRLRKSGEAEFGVNTRRRSDYRHPRPSRIGQRRAAISVRYFSDSNF